MACWERAAAWQAMLLALVLFWGSVVGWLV